ncbi:hypothetical protein Nepgr_008997 [Nepenthes gracilis]|uniref:Uncharacterized protein n=1 Tax=Nepenthes gracilis TaxID=150966 RepID=A0AAD3SAN5_NEPGR|nr:hypothetical protein Nepgr_008997 [Nepenthes gracilis]
MVKLAAIWSNRLFGSPGIPDCNLGRLRMRVSFREDFGHASYMENSGDCEWKISERDGHLETSLRDGNLEMEIPSRILPPKCLSFRNSQIDGYQLFIQDPPKIFWKIYEEDFGLAIV